MIVRRGRLGSRAWQRRAAAMLPGAGAIFGISGSWWRRLPVRCLVIWSGRGHRGVHRAGRAAPARGDPERDDAAGPAANHRPVARHHLAGHPRAGRAFRAQRLCLPRRRARNVGRRARRRGARRFHRARRDTEGADAGGRGGHRRVLRRRLLADGPGLPGPGAVVRQQRAAARGGELGSLRRSGQGPGADADRHLLPAGVSGGLTGQAKAGLGLRQSRLAFMTSGGVSASRRHSWPKRGSLVRFQSAKIPFRTWPSWPKKLVVPDGFDLKLNPEALLADHFIVTGLLNTRPVDPRGFVTAEGCVAGPSQRMSKETVAPTDTGVWRWNKALGILKKSLTWTFAACIRALPSSRSTSTPSWPSSPRNRARPSLSSPDWSGTVQNNPPG